MNIVVLKFQDLDTKKYFTLRLIATDAQNYNFVSNLAKSRGHSHFRRV